MSDQNNLPNGYLEKAEEKKTDKVIEGNVVQKKKSTTDKLLSTFIVQDLRTVRTSILNDIIIPGIKDAISKTVSNGIDMLLYGDTRDVSKNNTGGTYVSYASYYGKGKTSAINNRNRVIDRRDLDDYILSRSDAERVLGTLEDIIDKYGQASVADYYDTLGETSNFTDYKYGWTSLRGARIVRKGNGYSLDLPRAILLD